jgi:hypothetical protein
MEAIAGKNDGVIPPEAAFTVGGKAYTIRPVKFPQFDEMLTAAAPLIQYFETEYQKRLKAGQAVAPVVAAKGEVEMPPMDWVNEIDIMEAVRRFSKSSIAMIRVAAPQIDPNDLEIDEGLRLTKLIIQVNLDFFMRRVLPELGDVFVGIARGIIGSTSARPSSQPTTH